MAYPTFVAASTPVTGLAAVASVPWPSGIQADDAGFLIVETTGTSTVPTVVGWYLLANKVDVASIAGSNLIVYWARATGATMPNASIPAMTDHYVASIVAFRGVIRTGAAFGVATVSSKITASTVATMQTVTPTNNENLILMVASRPDDSASTTNFSGATNSALSNLVEHQEAGTISGNGGGYVVMSGRSAGANIATGTTAVTSVASTTNNVLTVTLPPHIPTAPISSNPVQYDSDNKTPLAVGGIPTGGISTGLYIGQDVRQPLQNGGNLPTETFSVQPRFEVDPLAVDLTGVPYQRPSGKLWLNPDEPNGLRAGGFCYDTIQDRFLAWGGANGATSYNTLWELRMDGGRGKWKQLFPTGTPPIGRYQGGMVFDAVNNRLLTVFGFTSVDTNQIYACDFTSTTTDGTWAAVLAPTGTAPSARSNVYQSIANDPANRCFYVFAGWGAAYYNGIYKFDYTTSVGAWSTVAADGAAGAPGIRRSANLFLDKVNNRLIAWGGAVSGTTFDTALYACALSNGAWTTLSPTGGPPVGRELAAGAVDPVSNTAWVWGGWQGAAANMQQSLWKLDMNSTNCTWTNVSKTANYMPAGTYGTPMSYDPDNKLLVLWSGVDTSTDIQHWVRCVDPAEATPTIYGLNMNHFPRPTDAHGHVFVNGKLLMVGGYSQISDNSNYDTSVSANSAGHVQDVFELDTTLFEWRNGVSGAKTFPSREGMSVVYDSTRSRYLAFGGLWGGGQMFNDVWEIKKNTNGDFDVRQMSPTGTLPGGRWLHAAAYDLTGDRMIITGGNLIPTSNYNDVWTLDFAGSSEGAWTLRTPTGTAPTGWWAGGFGWKASTRQLFIYGGATSAGDTTYTNVFKLLDMSTTAGAWSTLTVGPTARRSMGFAFDSTNNQICLFGGYDGTNTLNDLYFYNVATNAWTTAITATGTAPAARRSHAMTYDTTNSRYIINHGRPAAASGAGSWLGDILTLVPDYVTTTSSAWTGQVAKTWEQSRININSLISDWYEDTTVTSSTAQITSGAGTGAFYQSFTATRSAILREARFFLARQSTITGGSVQAEIWTHSGTYGTSSVPGTLLATATAIPYTSLGVVGPVWTNFTFTGVNKINLVEGTNYVVLIRQVSVTPTTGAVIYVYANTSGAHSGNFGSVTNASVSAAIPASDALFRVLTDLPNNTPYHWQYWATDGETPGAAGVPLSFGNNIEAAADFKFGTIAGYDLFSKQNSLTVPTTNNILATPFTPIEYTNVTTTNSVFTDVTGNQARNIAEFQEFASTNTTPITVSWTGKTTVAGSTATIFLQIYNITSGLWETLSSNTTVAINTAFTLTGAVSTSLASYYGTDNLVSIRVYQ